jgi:hypothetical protein
MIGWPLLSATWPVLAVGIGDAQGVARARARHVGDARREDALLAGQLLVDEIGDAVRRQAQVAGLDGAALAAELAALDDIPELEADVVATVGEARHRAADERVGRARAPLRHLRAGGLVEAGRLRVDDAEGAAALEVGANDRRDRLRDLVFVAKADHRDRQLGRADAGDLDPELGRRGQRGEREQRRASTAPRKTNLGQ